MSWSCSHLNETNIAIAILQTSSNWLKQVFISAYFPNTNPCFTPGRRMKFRNCHVAWRLRKLTASGASIHIQSIRSYSGRESFTSTTQITSASQRSRLNCWPELWYCNIQGSCENVSIFPTAQHTDIGKSICCIEHTSRCVIRMWRRTVLSRPCLPHDLPASSVDPSSWQFRVWMLAMIWGHKIRVYLFVAGIPDFIARPDAGSWRALFQISFAPQRLLDPVASFTYIFLYNRSKARINRIGN
jgi:hypothetical protein